MKVDDLADNIDALLANAGWDTDEQIAVTPAVGAVEIQTLEDVDANECSALLNTLHDAGIPYCGTWQDLRAGRIITVPLEI